MVIMSMIGKAVGVIIEGIGYLEIAWAIFWMTFFLGAAYLGNLGGETFTKEFITLLVTSQTFLREDQLVWLVVGGNLTLPLGVWWASWRFKYLYRVPVKFVNRFAMGLAFGTMYHFGGLICSLFIEENGWKHLVSYTLTIIQ